MQELIKNTVYYEIFNNRFKDSTQIYNKKDKLGNHNNSEIVKSNRQAILSYYNVQEIVVLRQVHGTKVIDVKDMNDYNKADPECDGAVTSNPRVVLTIQTADCIPILLSSCDGMVIGVAHCGWRGAKFGIINNIAKLMIHKGAEDIKAFMGPSIQQNSYEVDEEYYNSFVTQRADYAKFFVASDKTYHYKFDLPGYVALQLNESGIKDVTRSQDDTYTNLHYASYRRSYHNREKHYGTILSTIVIQ